MSSFISSEQASTRSRKYLKGISANAPAQTLILDNRITPTFTDWMHPRSTNRDADIIKQKRMVQTLIKEECYLACYGTVKSKHLLRIISGRYLFLIMAFIWRGGSWFCSGNNRRRLKEMRLLEYKGIGTKWDASLRISVQTQYQTALEQTSRLLSC